MGLLGSLFEAMSSLSASRQVVESLTRRRIIVSYRDSLLGMFWALSLCWPLAAAGVFARDLRARARRDAVLPGMSQNKLIF